MHLEALVAELWVLGGGLAVGMPVAGLCHCIALKVAGGGSFSFLPLEPEL